MLSCVDATREGVNTFLHKQKEAPGEATMTLVQFDDVYELNYNFVPVSQVPYLTRESYCPRGSTALYDAIGKCITETGARLALMPEAERPFRVLVVIQTDGFENASREYTSEQINQMVTHQQQQYKWDFLFLGANQNAVLVGGALGISASNSLTYDTRNSKGIISTVADKAVLYRSSPTHAGATLCCSFSDDDRVAAVATELPDSTVTSATPPVITKVEKKPRFRLFRS